MCRPTLSHGAGLAVIALVFCTSREARANVAEGASSAIVTDQGPLKGINTPTGSNYLGIPFAVAPVGNLRWRPPQPPAHFKGSFRATQFGNFCPRSRRNHDAEGDDRDTQDHDRDGVADAPDCPDERRAADASMARDNGAYRDHVMGIARMPYTEEEPDPHYCE